MREFGKFIVGVIVVLVFISIFIGLEKVIIFLGNALAIIIGIAVVLGIIFIVIRFKFMRRLVLFAVCLVVALVGFTFSVKSMSGMELDGFSDGIVLEAIVQDTMLLINIIGVGLAILALFLCLVSVIFKLPNLIWMILPWAAIFEALLYLIGVGVILYWQITVFTLIGIFSLLALLYIINNRKNIKNRFLSPIRAWSGMSVSPISDAKEEKISSDIRDNEWTKAKNDAVIEAMFEIKQNRYIYDYKLKNNEKITKLSIPEYYKGNRIIAVRLGACEHLTAVKINGQIIYKNGLANSPKLEEVVIENCGWIGDLAFDSCTKLKKVIFEDTCTIDEIGAYAFMNCKSLEKIILPKCLKKIRKGAFALCASLKAVHLPKKTELIGKNIFLGCDNLTIYTERTERDGYFQPNWNGKNYPVCWSSTAYRKI